MTYKTNGRLDYLNKISVYTLQYEATNNIGPNEDRALLIY